MKKISIVNDFGTKELTNRDKFQRDGTFTGEDFRTKYLSELDAKEAWNNNQAFIEVDFTGVTKLGPSWANEVFAYFTKYAKPELVLSKITPIGLSRVKQTIIDVELAKGYRGK